VLVTRTLSKISGTIPVCVAQDALESIPCCRGPTRQLLSTPLKNDFPHLLGVWTQAAGWHRCPLVQNYPQDKTAEEFMVRKDRLREGLCLEKGTKML